MTDITPGPNCAPATCPAWSQDEGISWEGKSVVALETLQFASGGLIDPKPVDGYRVHLVRRTRVGTPGSTLCRIDRFAKGGAGWSVGGGVTGPNIKHDPCGGCVAVAADEYAGLPIVGSVGAAEIRAAIAQGTCPAYSPPAGSAEQR